MKLSIPPAFLAAALSAALFLPSADGVGAQEGGDQAAEMAAMMAKAKRYTEPGPQHELLQRFLGEWDIETRFFMGGQASPPEKGTAVFEWLMEGRWIQVRVSGQMMGTPYRSVTLLGYDNFKQSYVMTTVSSLDTAMNRAEGDLDPGGVALLLYGTLDEYLTGEHDKMVKYVWRFVAEGEMVLEVHDLPIGEKNTKVVEFRYKRRS